MVAEDNKDRGGVTAAVVGVGEVPVLPEVRQATGESKDRAINDIRKCGIIRDR